jgi:hypothetical protein
MREYQIEDDGYGFQVSLYLGGVQVGNALFPDDGTGEAFGHAKRVGESWAGFPSATVSGLKLH